MSATEEPIIEVRGLTKAFDNVLAVNGLSFEVMPGQVVGFIGANGAGKTTTMRILATLEMPDSGSVRIGGWDIVEHPHEVRKLVGWMPDAYGAYSHVTVEDYLDFYARACGFRREERERRVREVMDFADLTVIRDRPMNGLSKGMGQRLCFGRALLQNPKVLILDEPAAGLDPKARIEFKNLVQILSREGSTIFISSHILSELGEMCDSLLFIDQGRLLHQGTADALRNYHATSAACLVDIQFDGLEAPFLEWIAMHPDWKLVQQSKGSIRAELASNERSRLAEELRRMILDGLAITDFHRQDRRLEDVFVDVLKQSKSAALIPPPLSVSPRS